MIEFVAFKNRTSWIFRPVSSRVSRAAQFSKDSPNSRCPPGNPHVPLITTGKLCLEMLKIACLLHMGECSDNGCTYRRQDFPCACQWWISPQHWKRRRRLRLWGPFYVVRVGVLRRSCMKCDVLAGEWGDYLGSSRGTGDYWDHRYIIPSFG